MPRFYARVIGDPMWTRLAQTKTPHCNIIRNVAWEKSPDANKNPRNFCSPYLRIADAHLSILHTVRLQGGRSKPLVTVVCDPNHCRLPQISRRCDKTTSYEKKT